MDKYDLGVIILVFLFVGVILAPTLFFVLPNVNWAAVQKDVFGVPEVPEIKEECCVCPEVDVMSNDFFPSHNADVRRVKRRGF